jgi:hypothetical protein
LKVGCSRLRDRISKLSSDQLDDFVVSFVVMTDLGDLDRRLSIQLRAVAIMHNDHFDSILRWYARSWRHRRGLPARHSALDLITGLLFGQTQFVELLQVHPQFGGRAKPLAENMPNDVMKEPANKELLDRIETIEKSLDRMGDVHNR